MKNSLTGILPFINRSKSQGKSIILATGVFDILHQEHINFLTKAKAAGDILVIAVETDSRVQQIKGPDRPVNNQAKRLTSLTSLNIADYVIFLPRKFNSQADWEAFIKQLKPDIYAVSSHTHWLKNKQTIMEKFGGQLKIVHNHNPTISTTKLLGTSQSFKTNVITGHGRGKGLGYPTLNLTIPKNLTLSHGIYAGTVTFANITYKGAFHFGPIPLFKEKSPSLEVFVLDTDIKTPPKSVQFRLIKKLRNIRSFSSKKALVSQILKDVAATRMILKIDY